MAPEQAGGDTVDHRADIYALRLIAYDMLSASRLARADGGVVSLRSISP